jgi:stage II sporulation protein D
MQLSRDRVRTSRRAAAIVIIAAALLAAAWAAPRSSEAVAAWLRPETVKTRGLAVADRLMVTAATSDGAAPGDARSATDAGSFGVAPQAVQGTRTVHAAPPAVVTLAAGADFTMVGVMCDVPEATGAVVIRIRTSLDGGSWSRWYEGPLELAADGAGAPRAFMDAMWTGAARYVQVSARADGARAPLALDGVRLMAIDTGGSDSLGDRTAAIVRRLVATIAGVSLTPAASAAVSQPTWVTRKAWGADESLRSGTPDTAPVKMAFIHHTAGGNTYAQADAPALVRGIYAYHTLGLGWSDIGYNFLIDRFGTIYEGRYGGVTKGVIGAQVLGFNTGSTGISVMGTYSSEAPPVVAVSALENLLAWKLSLSGLDPAGKATMTCGSAEKFKAGATVTFSVIAGHRDANYTECPGDALYGQLPAVREAVAARIAKGVPATKPWSVTLTLPTAQVEVNDNVTYSGSVKSATGGLGSGTVTVQKRLASGGEWIDWRSAALRADGSYAVSVTMTNRQSWEFRAKMPADQANLTGYSALQALTVIAAEPAATTQDSSFTISGHGWGHGIGMSQWGAYGLAKHGSSYKAILKHYYTGIGFTTTRNATVRVLLRSGLKTVKLTCPYDFTVRGSAGAVTIPGGTTATTTYVGGKYRVVAGGFSKDFTAAVTFKPTKGQLNVRTATDLRQTGPHRGTIRIAAAGTSLMMINHVALESYLRGVVPHEVSPSWPIASLKAQACAARSYAERARRAAKGQWDLYCDVRSQAYGGTSWEDPRTDAAIKATSGIVPSYGGEPIQAFYFSSSGGHTENIELAWATSPLPYLKGVNDPYDSYAPLHNWGPLRRTSTQLTASLGTAVKGSLRAIYRVQAGTSPRIVKAAIIGSEGATFMHGNTLREKLGLYSAWATFKSMSISPAAADEVTIAGGESVTLSGRVYPALASGATVKLYGHDGAWHSRKVATVRHSQKLSGGFAARYSSYHISVAPTQTTRYYFLSGVAKSPATTVTVE